MKTTNNKITYKKSVINYKLMQDSAQAFAENLESQNLIPRV